MNESISRIVIIIMALSGTLIFSCKKKELAKDLSVGVVHQLALRNKNNSTPFYRVDRRPPSEIFDEGFRPWGNNTDLLAHVRGVTSGANATPANRNSAFVATTSGRQIAMEIASEMLASTPTGPVWIYEVQPDHIFL